METLNPNVDQYLIDGCGRCEYYKTSKCKVNTWYQELVYLRKIVNNCGLTEEFKWKQPCYTYNGKNVLIVSAYKDYCCIAFFKGALLKDPYGKLTAPGENSQSGRQYRFTSLQEIAEQEDEIKTFVFEAIEVEKAGLKIDYKGIDEYHMPEELELKFKELPALEEAFNSLTPGRQKGYLLYFSSPKQSKTRDSRIEKYIPRILNGKGIHDR